ncbi:hypothetical protein HALDL1_11355 [Halobacterium sp. DL1]|jgi:hypothetical protein|nr:hypothetical protein HALDL1_11355 [Halobacterium sp. DL1]
MDSTSPDVIRIAGNNSDVSGVFTFFGKLVDTLGFGRSAHAATHRESGRTPSRPELSP